MWKHVFLGISIVIVSLSLLDLNFWQKVVKTEVSGLDIVFVLDVSKSMNALDFNDGKYAYSRLAASKWLINNFVSEHPGDRFGLIIFAWDASSISPLTMDHDTFLTFLHNVNYQNLNTQWSDISKAIELGVDRFKTNEDMSKVMILLSDGGDESDVDYGYISDLVEDQNILSFIVWVWTYEWSRIPLGQNAFGDKLYQRYNNQDVITKLNDKILQKIAEAVDGTYQKANTLDQLSEFNTKISQLETSLLEMGASGEERDASRLLAVVAVIFFGLYMIMFLLERSLFAKSKKWN